MARGVIQMESKGNPSITNSAGNSAGTDWGLFQLNDTVGQGIGYSHAQLLDPANNITIGLPRVLDSIRRGQAAGQSGYSLFNFVLADPQAGHRSLLNQPETNRIAAWNSQGAPSGPPLPSSWGLPGLPALPGLRVGSAALDRQLGVNFANTGTGPNPPPPMAPGATAADVPKARKSLLDWFKDPLPDLRGAGLTAAGIGAGLLLLILGVVLLSASFSGKDG